MLVIFILICLYVLFELHTKYIIVKPLKSLSLKKGNLMICTHSYEHKDIFIMLQELKKKQSHFHMLFANKIWNYLLEPLRPSNVEFLYVENGTVNKIRSKLSLGNNIVIFLYLLKEPPTGIYHIIKNMNITINLVKIIGDTKPSNHLNSSTSTIILKNMFSKFKIEYKPIKYNIGNNAKYFMNNLIKMLYN